MTSKAALRAIRPTFEAAPMLIPQQRLSSMNQRASTRSRQLFELLRQARDFNPDVAKAYDNIVSLGNSEYDVHVYMAGKVDSDGQPVIDVKGEALLRPFMVRMLSEYSGAWDETSGIGSNYPGVNAMIKMALGSLFTYGGAAFEVELTPALDDIVDVYPVDPTIIDFQMNRETHRLMPGLMVQGPFTPLDQLRFRYIGKDPDPLQPGGRSPLLAILDTVFFQQQFMRELQAIAHMVNAPRMDIKVVEQLVVDALKQTRPDLFQPGSEDAMQTYMDQYLADIRGVIESLEADDAFVHYDAVETQFITPKGVAIPVSDLMNAIDRMMVSGVKQLPMLLGRNEGATTTHATVQWQIFIEHLKDYQRITQALVTWALNLYLRIQGRQSYATLEFQPHKTSDELLDAQAFNINSNTWATAVDRGWATDDEASTALLGHTAAGTPRQVTQPEPPMESPPRSAAALSDQTRAMAEDVSKFPAWLQRVHYSTTHDYRSWRASKIGASFITAAHELNRNPNVLKDMTESDARAWLYSKLHLTPTSATATLEPVLRSAGVRAATAAIEEQLRAIKTHKAVKITEPSLVKAIEKQASTSAKSIVGTYNDELKAEIDRALVDEQRDLGDILEKVRAALSHLVNWESTRNVWKEAQIALTETQTNVMRAIKEFFNRNEVEGQAEVFPYDSSLDVCYEYISRNPYPNMRTAIEQCSDPSLPAHPLCPHYLRLVGSGTLIGDLWTGGD